MSSTLFIPPMDEICAFLKISDCIPRHLLHMQNETICQINLFFIMVIYNFRNVVEDRGTGCKSILRIRKVVRLYESYFDNISSFADDFNISQH